MSDGYYIILLTDANAERNAEIRVLAEHRTDAERTSRKFGETYRFMSFGEAAETVRKLWHGPGRSLGGWHPTIVRVMPGGGLDFADSMRPVATAADAGTATRGGEG